MKKIVIPSVMYKTTCTLTAYATDTRLIIVKHYNYESLHQERCDVVKFNRDICCIDVDLIPCKHDGGLVCEKNDIGWVSLDDFTAMLKALDL